MARKHRWRKGCAGVPAPAPGNRMLVEYKFFERPSTQPTCPMGLTYAMCLAGQASAGRWATMPRARTSRRSSPFCWTRAAGRVPPERAQVCQRQPDCMHREPVRLTTIYAE